MTDLTPETIAHLRELDAARTQGAWHHVGNSIVYESGRCTCYGGAAPYGHEPMCGLDHLGDAAEPDAEFIATAANHMSALLDAAEERDRVSRSRDALVEQVKRLQDQIARAAMKPGQDRQKAMHAYAERTKAAEAEVSRLRAELAEARAQIEQVTALLADRSVIGTLNGHEVPLPMVHKADLRDALAPATQREEGE